MSRDHKPGPPSIWQRRIHQLNQLEQNGNGKYTGLFHGPRSLQPTLPLVKVERIANHENVENRWKWPSVPCVNCS